MRYIKTFIQEGRRYSEEISEDQYNFYTSKNYIAGDSSHKIHVLQEVEKPVINEDEQEVITKLEVDDNGAVEVHAIRDRSPEEIQAIQEAKIPSNMVSIQLPQEDVDLLMQMLAERKG